MRIECDEQSKSDKTCFFTGFDLPYTRFFEYKYDGYKPNYKESFFVTKENDSKDSKLISHKVQSANSSI